MVGVQSCHASGKRWSRLLKFDTDVLAWCPSQKLERLAPAASLLRSVALCALVVVTAVGLD